jgi:hypothetical protein
MLKVQGRGAILSGSPRQKRMYTEQAGMLHGDARLVYSERYRDHVMSCSVDMLLADSIHSQMDSDAAFCNCSLSTVVHNACEMNVLPPFQAGMQI